MKKSFRFSFALTLGVLSLVAATFVGPSADADPPEDAAVQVEPVEEDMHEFMEYFFQPTYKRLKIAMAESPTDKKVWKSIKSDAMILAEGGNTLLAHTPDQDSADWNKHSVQVRGFGGELYRAAKAKDFAKASAAYRSMLQHCNACHKQFENGKHILEP